MTSRFYKSTALGLTLCSLFTAGFPSSGATADVATQLSGVADQELSQRTAQQIIADTMKAYGGVDNFKRARERAYRARGKVVVTSSISGGTNSFDCDIIGKKDQIRIETTVLGQKSITAYDGTISWNQSGDWVSINPPTATARIADEVKHGFESLLESLSSGARAESLPPRNVSGRLLEVVRLDFGDGSTLIFFDPTSHLVARSEFTGDDPEQGHSITKAFEYSGYKLVDGIPAPFITTEFADGKKVSDTIMESLEVNLKLADNAFTMPPPSTITALANGPVTIPFDYSENEIIIMVRINDREYPFVVDTGASTTVIDKKIAQTLTPGDGGLFTITTGGEAMPLHYVTLPEITLGAAKLPQVSALISDLSSLALGIKKAPAGIIGANILKRFLVVFDYPNKRLLLSDPQKAILSKGAVIIPTRPAFGSTALVVDGKLNGKKAINLLVDTGAAFNNLPPALAKDFLHGPQLKVAAIAGLDGKQVGMSSLQLDSLEIGALKIDHPVFATVVGDQAAGGLINASSMGILGNPIWSQFKVTIDYLNERLLIEPPPGKAALDEAEKQLEAAHRQYMRDKDLDKAVRTYEKILGEGKSSDNIGIQALACDYLAGTLDGRPGVTTDAKQLQQMFEKYELSAGLAESSGNSRLHARILADWAKAYLRNSSGSDSSASSYHRLAHKLLVQALTLAPLEPNVYAVLGLSSQLSGRNLIAEKLVDQALLSAPDNWTALWTKLKLARDEHADTSLIVAQLKRYYSGVPEVDTLNDHEPISGKTKP